MKNLIWVSVTFVAITAGADLVWGEDADDGFKLIDEASALIANNQTDKALEVLYRATRAAELADDADLRETMLLNIALLFARAGHYNRALETTYLIANAERKDYALSDIARRCLNAGNYRYALQIINAMGKISSKTPFLADAAKECARRGLYDEAFEAIEMIRDPSQKIVALTDVADSYAKAGLNEHALETLLYADQIAEESGDTALSDFSLANIADFCLKNKRVETAFEAAQLIANPAQKNLKLFETADAFLAKKQYERAISAITMASKEYAAPKIRKLYDIVAEFVKTGRENEAKELMNQILALTEEIEDDDARNKAIVDIKNEMKRLGFL